MQKYSVISADSHVNSPPDIYEGRMPAQLVDRAPRVEDSAEGSFWVYEDKRRPATWPDASSRSIRPTTAP